MALTVNCIDCGDQFQWIHDDCYGCWYAGKTMCEAKCPDCESGQEIPDVPEP